MTKTFLVRPMSHLADCFIVSSQNLYTVCSIITVNNNLLMRRTSHRFCFNFCWCFIGLVSCLFFLGLSDWIFHSFSRFFFLSFLSCSSEWMGVLLLESGHAFVSAQKQQPLLEEGRKSWLVSSQTSNRVFCFKISFENFLRQKFQP